MVERTSDEDSDDVRDFIGYRASAKTIQKRLELNGFNYLTLKEDFNVSLERYIDQLEYGLRSVQERLSKTLMTPFILI